MPLWQIIHGSSAFNEEDKKKFSQDITRLYYELGKMPKFYVNVIFQQTEDMYIGGEKRKDFVRIIITHLAREEDKDEAKSRRMQAMFDEICRPYIQDRGLEAEYHYVHHPRLFWKVNFLVPPPQGSDEERRWRELNRATPYSQL